MADETLDKEVKAEDTVAAVDQNTAKFNSLSATIRKTRESFEKEMNMLKAELQASKSNGTATPEDENDIKTELKKYKQEFNKLQRTLQEEKQAAQNERDRTEVFNTFNSIGVMNAKILYNHLSAEKMIDKDEDGMLVFRAEKNGITLPLDLGLKEYLSTNEGKTFLPATGVSGSGNKFKAINQASYKQPYTQSKEDKKAEDLLKLIGFAKRQIGRE